MYPILFRIPLPHRPLFLWWALAAAAVVAVIYAIAGQRKGDKNTAVGGFGIAAALGIAGYVYRTKSYEITSLPIFSFGVMLALSLIAGWYLTLWLSDKGKLPKEDIANAYVIGAVCALFGARALYIMMSEAQDSGWGDFFAIRKGGGNIYGALVGGFLGSVLYLRVKEVSAKKWFDVAAPSLAFGLFVNRVGSYLDGTDFGTRLKETAPAFLQKLGTFKHWTGKALDAGEGAPAFLRHRKVFEGSPLGAQVLKNDASLPIHPVQLYEALVGLALFGLLMWQRKKSRFDGQVFYLGVFSFSAVRFVTELVHDDDKRGAWGPDFALQTIIPFGLLVFAVAFVFGISLVVDDLKKRSIARGVAFIPAVVAYILLRPAAFTEQTSLRMSNAQVCALIAGILTSVLYAQGWVGAGRPTVPSGGPKKGASSVSDPTDDDEDSEEDDEDEIESPEASPAKS